MAFAFLIARRLILVMWKQEASPTYVQWVRDVMGFLHLEKQNKPMVYLEWICKDIF